MNFYDYGAMLIGELEVRGEKFCPSRKCELDGSMILASSECKDGVRIRVAFDPKGIRAKLSVSYANGEQPIRIVDAIARLLPGSDFFIESGEMELSDPKKAAAAMIEAADNL
jgi:hypothetical protein